MSDYPSRLLAAAQARVDAQAALDQARADLEEAQKVYAARRRQLADADAEMQAAAVEQ